MLIERISEPLSTPLGEGDTALLNERTGEYLTFNATASAVWEQTGSPIQFDVLVAALAKEYSVDQAVLESDVKRTLAMLEDKQLIKITR